MKSVRAFALRLRPWRLLWVIIALLAAFVVFVECIADLGGSADPRDIPIPTETPAAAE